MSGTPVGPSAGSPPETILIVEDEALIRLELAEFLQSCGYHVLEAGDAGEAIGLIRSGVAVDLVFTDVQMPGPMDGLGLARWLRAHRPEIRVILASGVAETAELAAELCELGPLEAKPYHRARLLERIRRAMAA
jgi:CheY-like chemotaxis protein